MKAIIKASTEELKDLQIGHKHTNGEYVEVGLRKDMICPEGVEVYEIKSSGSFIHADKLEFV